MKMLTFAGFKKWLALLLCLFTGLLHIGQFTVIPMESVKFFSWHVMLGLTLTFLYKPLKPNGHFARHIIDAVLIALSLLVGGSVIFNYDAYSLMMQSNQQTLYFRVLGVIAALLSLEAGRRTLGLALPLISIITVVYAMAGGNLPGVLAHRGYRLSRVAATIFSDQGIFGTPIAVSASNIYLFLLFAGLLGVSGADVIFQNIAIALTGKKRGGPAKMAVVTSCLFGSISGSAVANVMSTGTFTIPLMKRQGYQNRFAGAVEAVASTGGQIMPPIMGSAAFILSDITGTPYGTFCLVALLPALMYYTSLFKMVDLESIKHGLKGIPEQDLPDLKKTLRRSFKLFFPLAVLLVFLLIVKTTPMNSVIFAGAALIVCGFFSKENRLTPMKVLKGFEDAGKNLPQVVSACACSGIVMGMFALTGLGLKFSNFLIQIGGSNILLSLILAMLICLILGMGLPATAAYIICATAIAPALVKIGIPVIAAHLFLFYFSCISAITPPVAVASYAASGIADENAFKIGLTAVKLGIAGFVLPFTFALNPDYLHLGFDSLTLFTWISAFVVCYSAAIILQGFTERKISIIERFLFCVVVFTSIQSSFVISVAGWLLFAALYWGMRFMRKKPPALPVSAKAR
jgi:TRAP transporter 4TM/12TM fusion protein